MTQPTTSAARATLGPAWTRKKSARQMAQERMERARAGVAPLPEDRFHHFSARRPGSGFAAKRNDRCVLCDIPISRGETIRPVGLGIFAHWQCCAEYVPPKSPRAVVTAAGRALSGATELRRRVFWAVACAECGAGEGVACQTQFGARRVRNHIQRVLAYSVAKRLRQVVGDASVLAQLRATLGRPERVEMLSERIVREFCGEPLYNLRM